MNSQDLRMSRVEVATRCRCLTLRLVGDSRWRWPGWLLNLREVIVRIREVERGCGCGEVRPQMRREPRQVAIVRASICALFPHVPSLSLLNLLSLKTCLART